MKKKSRSRKRAIYKTQMGKCLQLMSSSCCSRARSAIKIYLVMRSIYFRPIICALTFARDRWGENCDEIWDTRQKHAWMFLSVSTHMMMMLLIIIREDDLHTKVIYICAVPINSLTLPWMTRRDRWSVIGERCLCSLCVPNWAKPSWSN
jgi:hypothetical protein